MTARGNTLLHDYVRRHTAKHSNSQHTQSKDVRVGEGLLYDCTGLSTVQHMQHWDTRSQIGALAALGGALLATLTILGNSYVGGIGVAILSVAVAFFALPGAARTGSCPSCHSARRRQDLVVGESVARETSLTDERSRRGEILVRRGFQVVVPVSASCQRCGVTYSWEESRFVPVSEASGSEEACALVSNHVRAALSGR